MMNGPIISHAIKLCTLALLLSAASCARQAPQESYCNGFFSTESSLSKTEYRWQLWRTFKGKTGLVCEAVVSDNTVLTFMPTVISQLHVWKGTQGTDVCGSFAEAHIVESCHLYYRLLKQKKGINQSASAELCRVPEDRMLSMSQFSNEIQRVSNIAKDFNPVLEVETPCRFDQFKNVVRELTRVSGSSLAILPRVQRKVAVSWEEMAEMVDSARYRESNEEPDIPVFLPDKQPSQVERDFVCASASHSADRLEHFVESHPNEDEWTRKGLFALGALFTRRGQHAQAIDVYKRAIKLFGTNTVQEQATRIAISDLAHVEIAKCLNTMGRYREAISNLNEIQESRLREAIKVGSHEPKQWKESTTLE